MADPIFCIDWYAGASAQVELFSPGGAWAKDVYQLKYTPAFRATIRPPVEERPLGSGELDPINKQLEQLAVALQARAGAPPAGSLPAPRSGGPPLDEMVMLGNQLLDLVIPQYVQADLRSSELSLEIGMDESLLEYPWELMHDGDNFLCLKHAVGRFVNGASTPMGAVQPATRVGLSLETLSVLLISVPKPLPRGTVEYAYLKEAEAETDAILETLKNVKGVKLTTLIGKNATFNEVYNALKSKNHIVHFNGHAHFNDAKPKLSGLVLFDQDMTTGPVVNYFGKNPPILCFINACETTKAGVWKEGYNIFGLARAFLDTGAYLLGSRWRINDKAAADFATRFYTAFLAEQKSLGTAVRVARSGSKAAAHDEFAWASYILYGDPRVCFRRL